MAIFSVPIKAISVSAAQDLFSIKVGATYPILIHEIRLGQKTLTAAEGKEVEFHRLTATVTQGSGGTVPTAFLHSPGGAASTVTVHINDTSSATSSGTDVVPQADVWQFLNGFFYLPSPEDRLFFAPATGFTLKLPTAPSAAMLVSGNIIWEELGV